MTLTVEQQRNRETWKTTLRYSLLTPPNPYSKTGGRTIVIAWRRYRSKWVTLQCFCRRARKDGSCRTLDQLVPILRHPELVRFSHEESAT